MGNFSQSIIITTQNPNFKHKNAENLAISIQNAKKFLHEFFLENFWFDWKFPKKRRESWWRKGTKIRKGSSTLQTLCCQIGLVGERFLERLELLKKIYRINNRTSVDPQHKKVLEWKKQFYARKREARGPLKIRRPFSHVFLENNLIAISDLHIFCISDDSKVFQALETLVGSGETSSLKNIFGLFLQ